MIDHTSLAQLMHDIGAAANSAGPDKGWLPGFVGAVGGSYNNILRDAVLHQAQQNQQEQQDQPKNKADERIKQLP